MPNMNTLQKAWKRNNTSPGRGKDDDGVLYKKQHTQTTAAMIHIENMLTRYGEWEAREGGRCTKPKLT